MKKGRRICIFTSHYLPYLGGVENYTRYLAEALVKRGDKVVIVTSNDGGLEEKSFVDGIPLLRMPCFKLLDGRFPVSKPNRSFWKLHRKLMGLDIDLCIVQTRFYPHSLYGAWFAKKKKAVCILLDHGTSHMTVGSFFWDRLGEWYEHGITHFLKKYVDSFYGVSKDCCAWLEHFGIQAKGVLYNSVDPERIRAYRDHPVRDFKKELGIFENGKIITYTGRLVKEKGILELMEAVNSLKTWENIYLLIAGDGDEREAVEKGQNDRIYFLDRLSFEEVMALLGQTDIYCLPTDYPEGFPTSVLEAAAAETFVITTSRGGSKELIQDETFGIIMEDNCPETIREALEKAMEDPAYRRRAAQKAAKRLGQEFTWEKRAEEIQKIR